MKSEIDIFTPTDLSVLTTYEEYSDKLNCPHQSVSLAVLII